MPCWARSVHSIPRHNALIVKNYMSNALTNTMLDVHSWIFSYRESIYNITSVIPHVYRCCSPKHILVGVKVDRRLLLSPVRYFSNNRESHMYCRPSSLIGESFLFTVGYEISPSAIPCNPRGCMKNRRPFLVIGESFIFTVGYYISPSDITCNSQGCSINRRALNGIPKGWIFTVG